MQSREIYKSPFTKLQIADPRGAFSIISSYLGRARYAGDKFSRNELRRVKGRQILNNSGGNSVLPKKSKRFRELVMVITLKGVQHGL